MKKYVFLLSMALLALQFQSCSSSDGEPNEFNGKFTRSRVSGKIPGGGNTAPTEGPTFYMESSDDIKVVPKELTMKAEGGTDSIIVYVNFDLNDKAYERAVFFDYGDKNAKPWLDGEWNDNKFVLTATHNDSSKPRTVILTFIISNEDKSVNLEAQVLIIQKGVDKPGEVRPTLLEFPAEGGVKYANYYFGDYISLGRQMSDAARAWINVSWSDDNRFPDEIIVCVGPNTTKAARQDTIKMGFTIVKGSPFNERFIIPVVIKQAAGPHNLKDAKSYLVGSWRYKETVKGSYDINRDYLITFNSNGTYKEVRKEDAINYDYHTSGTEEGTYEVIEIIQESTNRMRLKVKMTYTNGSREAQFDVYAHRIFYWQPRLHYYDHE